jgi:SP family sugar:H+ symporter-like MFS transporter
MISGLLIHSDTPRYIIKRNNLVAATKALARIRRLPETDAAITEKLAEIQANHEYELSLGKV